MIRKRKKRGSQYITKKLKINWGERGNGIIFFRLLQTRREGVTIGNQEGSRKRMESGCLAIRPPPKGPGAEKK